MRTIIAARREVTEASSPWVFASWKKRGSPLEDLRKACARIAEAEEGRATARLMRPHDLRRSFAAAAARADVMGQPLKLLMGHAVGDVTEGYVGDMKDDLPAIAQRVEDRILAEATPSKPTGSGVANVVRLSRQRGRAA